MAIWPIALSISLSNRLIFQQRGSGRKIITRERMGNFAHELCGIILMKCLRFLRGAQLHTHSQPVMSLGYFALFLFVVSNTQAALFETLDHSVEGEVKIEGHTIVVENIRYDGTAPDAFFYVGTSGCPSGSRTRLEDDQLGRHSRQRNPVRGSSWSCPTTSEQVI